jgi:hypothetical protein
MRQMRDAAVAYWLNEAEGRAPCCLNPSPWARYDDSSGLMRVSCTSCKKSLVDLSYEAVCLLLAPPSAIRSRDEQRAARSKVPEPRTRIPTTKSAPKPAAKSASAPVPAKKAVATAADLDRFSNLEDD